MRNTDRGRALDVMTWGFPRQIPNAKGQLVDEPVTNVRNLLSSFWRTALTSSARRALIPVSAFAEYGPGVTGKLPLHWFSVPSRPVFAFAGIWRPLADNRGAYAFLTCEPNPLVAPFHLKAMPVVLHEDDYDRWLTCSYDKACALATPYPSQLMSVESPPEPSTTAISEDALLV